MSLVLANISCIEAVASFLVDDLNDNLDEHSEKNFSVFL